MTNTATCPAAAALAVASTASLTQAQTRPAATYQGQWFTTADGCSYTRTQAPGYAVSWILIQNPHHINKPDVADHCANML